MRVLPSWLQPFTISRGLRAPLRRGRRAHDRRAQRRMGRFKAATHAGTPRARRQDRHRGYRRLKMRDERGGRDYGAAYIAQAAIIGSPMMVTRAAAPRAVAEGAH